MRSGNCLRAFGGWLAGCAAASVTFYAFVLVRLRMAPGGDAIGLVPLGVVGLVSAVPIIFAITSVCSGLPAALVIWLSEKFQWRSILFFGGAGVAIGVLIHYVLLLGPMRAASPSLPGLGSPLVVAGLVAGLTYWLVAGKHAGRNRSGDQP